MHPLLVIIVIANINVPIALDFVYFFMKIEFNLECSQPTTEKQFRHSASTVETPSRKNANTNADQINIGMYSELTVVTGVLICCILLLLMVREIRIHYCTPEDIVYV